VGLSGGSGSARDRGGQGDDWRGSEDAISIVGDKQVAGLERWSNRRMKMHEEDKVAGDHTFPLSRDWSHDRRTFFIHPCPKKSSMKVI
jgi:hypothetical protein